MYSKNCTEHPALFSIIEKPVNKQTSLVGAIKKGDQAIQH